MKFKFLGVLIVLGIALWFGWWWLAATAQKEALSGWLSERRAAGWQAEAVDINVKGFPNRLDATITNPALADPVSGWAWEAPFLQIHQIAYNPSQAIVIWPETQTIAAPGAVATLTAKVMQASLTLGNIADVQVERASFEARGAVITGVDGWNANAESWVQHIRRAPDAGPENAYEFRGDGVRIILPKVWRAVLDPTGTLPPSVESITFEGRAAFDRPLNRYALEGAKPQVVALSLKEAKLGWGGLALSVTGSLKADANGYAQGEMKVDAHQWEDMVDAAIATNILSETMGDAVKTGLGLLARLSGDKNHITAPLTFSGGLMKIGPIPIGAAPKLVN